MIWILSIIVIVIAALLTGSCGYNARARGILHERLENAPREPGTNILAGAAPVSIERGRDRACLLLHGFISSPADYGRLPEALDEAGWDVRVPLLPGHGRDPRELQALHAEDLISAAENELLELQNHYNTVALGGFSMGGSISLILAERHRPDATFLVNPFLRLKYHIKYVLPLRWWNSLFGSLLEYGIHPDTVPVNRPEGKKEVVRYHVIPTPIFDETFELADRARRTNLPDMPLLLLVSEDDQTVSPGKTLKHFRNTGNEQTDVKTYPRSNHVLMLDHDREEAIRDIISFLESAVR